MGVRLKPEAEPVATAQREGAEPEDRKSRLGEGLSSLLSRAREQTERMRGAALDRRKSLVLQHACAARERGNLEAAFWLLAEELEHHSDAPEASLAYWEVALELGRPRRAAAAAAGLVQRHAASGDVELATLCWIELVRAVPDALVPPTVLMAILPALRKRAEQALHEERAQAQQLVRTALRHSVDARNEPPTVGVALRIFEEGREPYPEAAQRAAELALSSPSLHEAKRARLLDWIAAHGAPPEPAAAAEPSAAASSAGVEPSAAAPSRVVEPEAAAPAVATQQHVTAPVPVGEPVPAAPEARAAPSPAASRASLQVLEATPIGVGPDALEVETAGSRRRIPYGDIEGISAVEIAPAASESAPEEEAARRSVVLIDLLLNLVHRGGKPLRVVRMRSDRFDPSRLVEGVADGAGLTTFLADLMARASAVPLPDPESALGLRLASFETIADYETQLVQRA